MCGLFGHFGFNNDGWGDITSKIEKLAMLAGERGPHAHGLGFIFEDDNGVSQVRLTKNEGAIQPECITSLDELHKAWTVVGHCRLATSGSVVNMEFDDIQPITDEYDGEFIMLAHNGNVYNALELVSEYNVTVHTSNDSAIILGLADELRRAKVSASWGAAVHYAISLVDASSPLALIAVSSSERSLIVARRGYPDGQPLYEGAQDGGLYFCSRKFEDSQLVKNNVSVNYIMAPDFRSWERFERSFER